MEKFGQVLNEAWMLVSLGSANEAAAATHWVNLFRVAHSKPHLSAKDLRNSAHNPVYYVEDKGTKENMERRFTLGLVVSTTLVVRRWRKLSFLVTSPLIVYGFCPEFYSVWIRK